MTCNHAPTSHCNLHWLDTRSCHDHTVKDSGELTGILGRGWEIEKPPQGSYTLAGCPGWDTPESADTRSWQPVYALVLQCPHLWVPCASLPCVRLVPGLPPMQTLIVISYHHPYRLSNVAHSFWCFPIAQPAQALPVVLTTFYGQKYHDLYYAARLMFWRHSHNYTKPKPTRRYCRQFCSFWANKSRMFPVTCLCK